jgi:hypothetical protein
MALIASKLCQYIRPDSSTNPDAESYEYYLVWLGVDGGIYSWLFEDFEQVSKVNGQIINQKSDNITKLFTNAEKSIKLVAEDLTENEFDTISKITRALKVRRYFKDSTYSELAIITDSFRKPKSQFRYNLELEIMEIEDKIMR